MVDPQTFFLNIMLLIGALLLLGAAFILSVTAWTCASALIWVIQRRRAQRKHVRETRREDGKPYPAFAEGTCGRCGRGSRRIYYPPSGDELCPTCYERFWRQSEGYAVA